MFKARVVARARTRIMARDRAMARTRAMVRTQNDVYKLTTYTQRLYFFWYIIETDALANLFQQKSQFNV